MSRKIYIKAIILDGFKGEKFLFLEKRKQEK